MCGRPGGRARGFVVGITLWLLISSPALADSRSDYLIQLLTKSPTFRVRAQAAISLGQVEPEPRVVRALTAALRDSHPAVRTAAAASLERLGDPSALDALRAARSDDHRAARDATQRAIRRLERISRTEPQSDPGPSTSPRGEDLSRGRFYVGVGAPGTKVARLSSDLLKKAHEFVVQGVSAIDGVVLAPESESPSDVQRTLSRNRQLTGYYLDSSIVSVEETSNGTRVAVSVIVATYPGRDMRAMLQGAATVPGARGPGAQLDALEAAIGSALRRLPQALLPGQGHSGL